MTLRGRGKKRSIKITIAVVVLLLGLGTAVVVTLIEPVGDTITQLTLPLEHEDIIRSEAAEKELDPALVAAVIKSESGFRARTSRAGAIGLMQLLPGTAKFIARKSGGTAFELSDLGDPEINIAYGTWYLDYLRDRYGDEMPALAAYNSGEKNVDRWLQEAREQGRELELGDIPFPETKAYVKRVFSARKSYRQKYPRELGL